MYFSIYECNTYAGRSKWIVNPSHVFTLFNALFNISITTCNAG